MPFFSLPSGASPVLAGNGAPTGGVGNAGDLFIDRANKLLYGPKDAVSGWPTGIDLSNGPTGPASTVPGPTGPASNVTGPTGLGMTGPTGAASTVTGPTGASVTGPTGALTSVVVGTVTTGVAAVTVTGTGASRTLNFVLPFVTGPTGAASTVTGPTGAVGATGPAPAVTSGPTSDTVFIGGVLVQAARGPTGAVGSTGPASTVTGPTGPSGGPTGPTGAVGPGVSLGLVLALS
jgi:hypothetical protein